MADPLWSGAGQFHRWKELQQAIEDGDEEKVAELNALLEECLEEDKKFRRKRDLDPNYGT